MAGPKKVTDKEFGAYLKKLREREGLKSKHFNEWADTEKKPLDNPRVRHLTKDELEELEKGENNDN